MPAARSRSNPHQAAVAPDGYDATPAPVSVLIVDDRREDLTALASLLEQPSCNIVCANSGAEALKRVLETDFAVILLDVVMPGMDGFELAATIKSRPRSQHTPIIFLTAAQQDVGAIYRAYSAGAVDYLMKPVDEAVVRAKVATFVDLYLKDQRIQAQALALREADRREQESKLAELRLLSEKRYRSVVERIPACVWTADAHGAVNYCNHRWFEFTGLGPEQSLGEGWLSALEPEDAGRVAAEWRAAREALQSYQTELRLRRADGTYRWHLCHVLAETHPPADVRGWLGTFTDCQELKEAVDARDEFLTIASHELRTPLSTLVLNIDALGRGRSRAGLDPKTARKLDVTARQVRRLSDLVDTLFDIAKISSGRLELEPKEVDLVGTVQECVARLEEEATRGGNTIHLTTGGRLVGRWDPRRLEQVITNLLSNAIKYGQGKPIEVDVASDATTARIAVTDHGIGIDPADRARIFERFERAASSRQYGGLGMGLYISRQIVEAHGGSIGITSEPGAGSTFTVQLPMRKSVAEADER